MLLLAGSPGQAASQPVSLAAAGANKAAEVRWIAEGSLTLEVCFESRRAFKDSVSGDCKNKATGWSSVSRSLCPLLLLELAWLLMASYFNASIAFSLILQAWQVHYRFLLEPRQARALIWQGLFKALDLSLPL